MLASPATALLGHDSPLVPPTEISNALHQLSSLEPGYRCVATAQSFAEAVHFARKLGCWALGRNYGHAEFNAYDGERSSGDDFLLVLENETLGRTGRWLASAGWRRPPDLVVIGDAIALGTAFGAVLLHERVAGKFGTGWQETLQPSDSATLARVAAVIAAVESEGLLQQGRELMDYLMSRLLAVQTGCSEIESVARLEVSIRIAFAAPLLARHVRRGMCERGVLAGVDEIGRLAIDPPLPVRIAEADVITGALRGAILNLPMVSASACCAACEKGS
jgi:hypothetical protein